MSFSQSAMFFTVTFISRSVGNQRNSAFAVINTAEMARAPDNPFGALTSTLFSTIISTVGIGFYFSSLRRGEEIADNFSGFLRSETTNYDFIVIGAGSGGGVVAARLARQYSVLLLEAGGDMNEFQQIPAMSLLLLKYPEVDWMFRTTNQKYSCFACPYNRSFWSAGKGLGGSSNVNFMIQSRGNPKDYDNWAKIVKDDSWEYNNLLPYFKKMEDYRGSWANAEFHGRGGPIRNEVADYQGMADLYLAAAKELGFPIIDLNGDYIEGFDKVYHPIKEGRRQSVYTAYINPSRNQTNLTIRKFAFVTKILFDKNKRAYAVEYDRHGKPKMAIANKEIILSAGAVNSPQLLMLSGIGPKDHLGEKGIPVISNLPVGKNLHDQISTYLGPFFINKPLSFSIERDSNSETIGQYFTQGRGPLTSSGVQAMGFVCSNYTYDEDWPDIELILSGVSIGPGFAKEFSRGYGLNDLYVGTYFEHAIGKESFSQVVSAVRPIARGDIKLKSTDPYNLLDIEPNYLDNKRDMNVMIEGMKLAVELVETTEVFRKIGAKFTSRAFPGCEAYKMRSDEYWECYARHFSISQHHVVGTCSMGTVVDSQLKVMGVKGLRVIDASIMPATVVGETNVPTMMIAEKGADMILKYWKRYGK